MIADLAARAPRIVSGLAILGVAAVTGLISYQHIEDLSLSLHQTLLAARLMPFGVDGLITVGSVVLLQGGRLGWLGVGPGVAISLFANIESGISYGWLAAVWAGIPAVSFALACFILERWLKGQTRPAGSPQAVTQTDTVAATESEPEPAPDATQDEPETVAGPRRMGMTLEEAADEFAAELAAGERPKLRQIQTRCHTGMPRARTIRTHLIALIDARVDAPADAHTRVHA